MPVLLMVANAAPRALGLANLYIDVGGRNPSLHVPFMI